MSAFPDSLDAVIDHLERAKEHGRTRGARRKIMAQLRDTRDVVPPPREAAPASAPAVEHVSLTETAGTKVQRLDRLREIASGCVKCPHLATSRRNVVFGVGNPEAEILFVGEAPGADEDAQGEPFVGRAGQLLTKIIEVMGYRREDVYIANILKCRPDTPGQTAGNRAPTPEEMGTCIPYLIEQVDIIRPRAIVALGATAVRGLLGNVRPLGELRSRWHDFRGIPVMVTYHPAYLLRNQAPPEKRKAWEDMLLVKEHLGHAISDRERRYFLPKS